MPIFRGASPNASRIEFNSSNSDFMFAENSSSAKPFVRAKQVWRISNSEIRNFFLLSRRLRSRLFMRILYHNLGNCQDLFGISFSGSQSGRYFAQSNTTHTKHNFPIFPFARGNQNAFRQNFLRLHTICLARCFHYFGKSE